MQISPFQTDSWFPPSHNVGNVRNLVNVGRWRNGHTLRTLLKIWKPNYISDSYWSTAMASTWKIEIDSIPTDFTYTWLICRICENVYVKIFTYTWFFTLPTLTTYVTWRWKSRVRYGWKSKIQDGGRSLPYWIFNKIEIFAVNDPCMTTIYQCAKVDANISIPDQDMAGNRKSKQRPSPSWISKLCPW